MRKALFPLVFICACLQSFSQGSVSGKLQDSATKKPLGLATVTVFRASDTALITYRLSNPEGQFKVPGLPLNIQCRVVISYSGYDAFRKEFTLTTNETLDLGTIEMYEVSKTLDEVLVIAERPPVTVKKDTIEFNASSFKTLPTALVEDLLKKMPGIQIDADGNITANGKKVNRILVDGKAFFGDDPKMATRNLPANVIDKVQVVPDEEEVNRNTTGDLTSVGQVINLTLKKGVKKGWFGKLYGGGGTDERYEAGGIANIYRDTLQLSVLAFSNNVNRSGFSFKEVQDLGGFSRSGMNSMMVTNRNGQTGFAVNGISFGGLDQGIARTTGAGFNLNHAPNKKNSFFLQYFFGNTSNNVDQLMNEEQYLNDTIVNNRTSTINQRVVYNHTANLGAKLKPDSLTDINFRAGYTYNSTDENIDALVKLTNNKSGDISTGDGNQFNNSYSHRYNHNIFITRRSGAKKGRSLNFSNSVNYSSNLQRYITETENEYFVPYYSQFEFNQLRRQDLPSLSVNTTLSWAEPLSKSLTMRFNNRHQYLRDRQNIDIFEKNPGTSNYEVLNEGQSSGFQRNQNRFSSYLGLSYKVKQWNFSAGLNGLWQKIRNDFRDISAPMNTSLFNVLPSVSFQHKQLSASYSMDVRAPGINYLIPVPDSTNPFNIRYGNPYLKPSREHNFYISNFNFFQGKGTTFNFYVNATFINSDVVMRRTVEANGVQTSRPVNANGSLAMYAGMGFGKEFKNKQDFIFSFRISPNMNFEKSKLLVNGAASDVKTFDIGPAFNLGLNWNDVVEFRPMYRPGINMTRYDNENFEDIKNITQYVEAELVVRWPKKLVWESNLGYRYNSQVAPGLPKTTTLWNAAVTLLMFKGDVGLLKFSVYDLLNRNNGYSRFLTGNRVVDRETNVLHRFGELSFTYNIRNMGAPKKVGGRDRLFFF